MISELVIGATAGAIADRVLGALLKGLAGHGSPRRALKTALSRALERFRARKPNTRDELFQDPVWEALQDEIREFLTPAGRPDANRMAARVRDKLVEPPPHLESDFEELFQLLRQEVRLQPDLVEMEILKAVLEVDERLRTLLQALGVDLTVEELGKRAHAAARIDLEGFSRNTFGPRTHVDLPLVIRRNSGDSEPIDQAALAGLLGTGNMLVIEAEPGAGKTTTLLQFAQHLLDQTADLVPFIVPLADWAVDGRDFFESIADRAAFGGTLLANHLRILAARGRLVLLLDGWNELSTAALRNAAVKLRTLQREYRNALVVVATRSYVQRPPLERSTTVGLKPLTVDQRSKIISAHLGQTSPVLVDHIDRHPAINAITRIPLYLATLLEVALQPPLPDTKESLLRACIESHEKRSDFSDHFQALGMHQSDYLRDLAVAVGALLELPAIVSNLDVSRWWIEALRKHATHAAANALLDLLWDRNKCSLLAREGELDVLGAALGELLRIHSDLRTGFLMRLVEGVSSEFREAVATIIMHSVDHDMLSVGLTLLSDSATRSVPGPLRTAIEYRVLSRIPVLEWRGAYNLVPTNAATLRHQLFQLVLNDQDRRRSAGTLLEMIDELRDEHGRPLDEPRHPNLQANFPWPLEARAS